MKVKIKPVKCLQPLQYLQELQALSSPLEDLYSFNIYKNNRLLAPPLSGGADLTDLTKLSPAKSWGVRKPDFQRIYQQIKFFCYNFFITLKPLLLYNFRSSSNYYSALHDTYLEEPPPLPPSRPSPRARHPPPPAARPSPPPAARPSPSLSLPDSSL